MNRIIKYVSSLFAIIITLVIVFACGYYIGSIHKKAAVVTIVSPASSAESHDLKLPGEKTIRIVTEDEVKSKLMEIGQLATYSGEYTVSKSATYLRKFLDNITIPGTSSSIALECNGIVKVGYTVSDITPTVDNDSHKIYIALPEASLLDNYIIWDSIESVDSNSILNPLNFSQYQTLIAEMEEEGLTKVESQGIYRAAEDNLKHIIENFLSGFDDYEIVFL